MPFVPHILHQCRASSSFFLILAGNRSTQQRMTPRNSTQPPVLLCFIECEFYDDVGLVLYVSILGIEVLNRVRYVRACLPSCLFFVRLMLLLFTPEPTGGVLCVLRAGEGDHAGVLQRGPQRQRDPLRRNAGGPPQRDQHRKDRRHVHLEGELGYYDTPRYRLAAWGGAEPTHTL